jgi:hypothetical protein
VAAIEDQDRKLSAKLQIFSAVHRTSDQRRAIQGLLNEFVIGERTKDHPFTNDQGAPCARRIPVAPIIQ